MAALKTCKNVLKKIIFPTGLTLMLSACGSDSELNDEWELAGYFDVETEQFHFFPEEEGSRVYTLDLYMEQVPNTFNYDRKVAGTTPCGDFYSTFDYNHVSRISINGVVTRVYTNEDKNHEGPNPPLYDVFGDLSGASTDCAGSNDEVVPVQEYINILDKANTFVVWKPFPRNRLVVEAPIEGQNALFFERVMD